ncbi:MAG: MBL fold metallo-hydrolase [Clostridia bacterium]|nr:MBL fold metallo-hydrolase [Clostridia bacterium]
MSKKSKSSGKLLVIKIVAVLCIIGLSLGFGFSQVGLDKIIEADSVDDILASAQDYIKDNFIDSKDSINQESLESMQDLAEVDGELGIYYFDVGQADCTLVSCDGEYMLIDAGNNEDGNLIVAQLISMGISKVKYLIGTHPHEDHIGGLDDVLKNFEVENLYMPDIEYDSSTYRNVISAAKKSGVTSVAPKLGHIFYVGEARCEIMGIDSDNEETNQTSIIVETTHGKNKFLFMADAEIPNEEKRLWNDVDVLKVGHHGSSTSSSDDFLEQTMPEVAVISCGEGNSYGHPHREVMAALKDSDVQIYRTDTQGTIHVSSDGKTYEISTFDIDLDGE